MDKAEDTTNNSVQGKETSSLCKDEKADVVANKGISEDISKQLTDIKPSMSSVIDEKCIQTNEKIYTSVLNKLQNSNYPLDVDMCSKDIKNNDSTSIEKVFDEAIDSVHSIEEGNNSQDEELLLRWEEDDDDIDEGACKDNIDINEDTLLALKDDIESNDIATENHLLEVDDGNDKSMLKNDNTDFTEEIMSGTSGVNDQLVKQSISQELAGKQDLTQRCLESQVKSRLIESSAEEKVYDYTDDKEIQICGETLYQNTKEGKILESMDVDEKLSEVDSYIPDEMIYHSKTNLNDKLQDESLLQKEKLKIDAEEASVNNAESSCVIKCCNKIETKECPINKDRICQETCISSSEIGVLEINKMIDVAKPSATSSINCETNIHDIPHITEQNMSSDHENKDAKGNEKVIEDKTKSDFMNMSLTIKTDHGLNEPDVMLEIPSQELIDIDELDLSMGQDLTADIEKVMQQSDDAQKDVYGQEEALKFSENLCKKRIKGIDEKGDLECLLKDRELITGSVLSEQQNKLSGNSPKVKLKDASTTAVVRKNSQEDLSGPLTIEIKEDKELITKNTTVCQIPTSTIEDISTDTLKSTTISKSSPEIVSSTVKTLPLTSECIVSTPDSEISTKKNLQSPSKILPPIEGLVFLPETVSSRSEIEPSSSNNKVSTVSQAIITLVSGTSPLTSQTSTSSSEFKLSTIEKISSLTEKTIQGTKLTSTNTEDSTKSVTLEEAISTTNVDSTGSEIVSITSKVALLPPSATGTAGVSSATTASIPKTIPSTSNTAVVLLSQTEPLFDAKGSLVKGSSPLVSEDKPLDSEVITSSFQTLQPTPEALPSEVTSNTEIMSPAVKDLTTSSEDITSSSTDKSVHSEIIHTSKAILQNSEAIPSTSKMLSASDFTTPSTSYSASTSEIVPNTFDAIPSTSTALPGEVASLSTMETDMSDQSLQMQDSLGLLAESSRVREDDDEMDDDECEDDEEMDIDDESSNQMTAEHSEDSNAPHSENEVKEQSKPATVIEEKSVPDDNILDPMCEGSNKKEEIKLKDSNELDKEIVVTESGGNSDTKRKGQKSALDTMKASDVRDTETEGVAAKRKKLEIEEETKKTLEEKSQEVTKLSPNKTMNLKISKACNVFNIVELEESSSEDDIQEVPKDASSGKVDPAPLGKNVMTSVNIPDDVVDTPVTPEKITPAVEMVTTSKTAEPSPSNDTRSDTTAIPPEAKTVEEPPTPAEAKMDLEVFNLDSDEEGKEQRKTQPVTVEEETPQIKKLMKCINPICKGEVNVYFKAETSIVAHYDAKKKKPMVCEVCYKDFMDSRKSLIEGIKNLTPLLELDMGKCSEDLVEISDSESDEEGEPIEMEQEVVGESAAKMLEDNLADLINESWKKYKMDARLKVTTDFLDAELDKLDAEGKEIDRILDECQVATDKLRKDLYTTFEPARKELPSIVICDLPNQNYSCFEKIILETSTTDNNTQVLKFGTASDAIPLTYEPLSQTTGQQNVQESKPTSPVAEKPSKVEEDKDVSVVQLSAEEAPADLPPCGEIVRPPLKVGSIVYGVRNAFGAWLRCKVTEVTPKVPNGTQYTTCSVKFESKAKNPFKVLSARNLAYTEPCSVRMVIGTRIIALFKDSANDGKRESFYSGIVAEIPNPVNNYRYLVFFDDGYAQYVLHKDTRLVCECSPFVWDEVHPFSREFVKKYLLAYPERPMVRLHAGQSLKTEWNGKWWSSRVVAVDASLVQVHFEEDLRSEWIYRGSTRLAPLFLELQAAERHRARPLPRTKAQARTNMPYVEYTRPDEPTSNKTQQQEEIRRQRAVAKKSTVPVAASANTNASANAPPVPSVVESTFTTRVVYYTPKNAVKPYKMLPHQCNKKCKRTDVLGLKELRTYNPLAKPLLSGWERQIVRFKGHREVMYRAPCGRRLRNMFELHKYLRLIHTDMSVDLFDFNPNTHCLAEFVISKCLVGKKDLSHGKENVPVPCVNTLDETLPEFCSYNTERTPTAGVPLNLDPDFLCGCDCTDDCQDKSKCACWQLTLEGAKTIGLDDPNIGYIYKRLPEPLPSGIYECNSRCKCKQTCLNRVAQHPLQLKLQVFKTMNRGWGIRALNDVPAGAFLCVYAGNLLTDATANLDGLNEGDEYLAELDYIEVVEQMKEGFEEDIPEADKKLDKEELNKESSEEESSEDEDRSNNDKSDGDFTPNYSWGDKEDTGLKKSLRKRERQTKNTENDKSSKESSNKEDCITISDDEEVREPARFAPQLGMGANEFISKYKSVRAHFGRDEACYIMDAKVQGNIGRYLNHSCSPNVFVQNVFVDTHDPRFPWVAFFALSHIRAGTELTWNYNYDVGSVPHKVLYCHCQAPNCRGRLL